MPFLYYGLVVVATSAVILAVYNLIIVRWCANQYQQRSHDHTNRGYRRNNTITTIIPAASTSSFKYTKQQDALDHETECCVCLSMFEEGEEIRKLGVCNHSFHASCIDMWLYSHLDCPLCRASVVKPPPRTHSSSIGGSVTAS